MKLLKRIFHKKKSKFYKISSSNRIFIGDKICTSRIKHLNINIQGENNTIYLHPNSGFDTNCCIQIFGNNNEVHIQNAYIGQFFLIFKDTNNCKFIWGDRTTATSAYIVFAESDSSLVIGKDCMLANADIRVSDGHTIYDMKTKKVLNHCPHKMVIGDHCWIGQGCMLTKNANLCDNVIVAAHSVVTKTFDTPHVIIAGAPAKIIKTDVGFSELPPSKFGQYFDKTQSAHKNAG